MARVLAEAQLTTRNARSKLAPGVHWRGIDTEVHLGYRRGKRRGVWLVRWRHQAGYRRDNLGPADDEIATGTLSYTDAVKAARERVEATRQTALATADGIVQTVRTAVEVYTAGRDARDSARRGRAMRSDASYKLERYVVGREARGARKAVTPSALADIALHELDETKILEWRAALPATLNQAAQRRIINDLKAALNAAYLAHRRKLPATLPGVIKLAFSVAAGGEAPEGGGDAVARDNQILSDEVVGKIIDAAREVDAARKFNGDLYRMVVVLAATGARFSQIARLKVRDVQPERSRLMMPASRKGKGRKAETTPIPIGPDVLEALAPAMKGRGKDEALLQRRQVARGEGSIRWIEVGRCGWESPSEIVRDWASIREIVGLAREVVPYALRHSSIVRGIRAGLPMRLVAALHDTSVAMIERHYGRWIADGLDDLAAAAVVPLIKRV